MEHTIPTTTLIITIFEIIGLILLALEVYLGHEMEEVASDFPFAKQLQFLYAIQDFRGFYIACQLDQGRSTADAQKLVNALGEAAVTKAVEDMWQGMTNDVTATIKKWNQKTHPKLMIRRKRSLKIGALLLITSATVHLFEGVITYLNH